MVLSPPTKKPEELGFCTCRLSNRRHPLGRSGTHHPPAEQLYPICSLCVLLLGADMPNSPFAKIAEADGLDFNSDKAIKKAELSAAQKENDVFDEHHVGRR